LHFFQRRFHFVQGSLRDQPVLGDANGTEHDPIQIQLDEAHEHALGFAARALHRLVAVSVLVFACNAVVNVFAMVAFDKIVQFVVRAGSSQLRTRHDEKLVVELVRILFETHVHFQTNFIHFRTKRFLHGSVMHGIELLDLLRFQLREKPIVLLTKGGDDR
jgi:hypothetical protein